MFKILPLLAHLAALCYGQWPLQSVGRESWNLKPLPPNQPGYPYDDLEWAELPRQPDTQHPELQLKNDLKFPDKTNLDDNALSYSDLISDNDWAIGWVKTISTNQSQIRNDTDKFIREFQDIYVSLGLDEADNKENVDNLYKYGTSVILRFILEFYRIFRKISSSQSNTSQIDVYGLSFDEAVNTMKQKRNYTHLQIAVPVRRAADIFKSIIYELSQSMEIVQTKCSAKGTNWECLILYLADLISESINCPNIWYHALIHMLSIDASPKENHFVYNVVNFVKLTGLPFEHIFDYVMEKIVEYREIGRVQFRKEALLFSLLADLQENGLLDCVYINDLYN